MAAESAAKKAQEHGVKKVDVFVKGSPYSFPVSKETNVANLGMNKGVRRVLRARAPG